MTRRPRIGGGRLWRDSHEGGPITPAPEVPLQLAGLKCWWDSRTSQQMNPSPETGVQTWTSRDGSMGAVALSQGTAGNRPVWEAAVAALGGKPAVRFDGVDDFLLALTASDWTFVHNVSTIFVVLRHDSTGPVTQRGFGTCDGLASQVGLQFESTPTIQAVRYCNGSGTYLNNADLTAAGHVGRDVSRWAAITHGGGVRTAYAGGGAAVLTNPDVGGQVPSASAPQYPLRIGGTSGSNALKGYVTQILLYDRALSQAEINSLGGFFAPIYGIAA